MRCWQSTCAAPFCVHAQAIRRMSTRFGGQGGAIVLISSRAALYGSPAEFVWYAALEGRRRQPDQWACAGSGRRGHSRECSVSGPIITEMHRPGRLEVGAKRAPMQRAGTAEEVAEAVMFLASDAASYVTGANLAPSQAGCKNLWGRSEHEQRDVPVSECAAAARGVSARRGAAARQCTGGRIAEQQLAKLEAGVQAAGVHPRGEAAAACLCPLPGRGAVVGHGRAVRSRCCWRSSPGREVKGKAGTAELLHGRSRAQAAQASLPVS